MGSSIKRLNKDLRQAVVGCLVVLFISACSSGPATQAQATQAQAGAAGQPVVAVRLLNDSVSPSTATIRAGDITFNVTNASTDEKHQFVVIKSDLAAGQLPVGGNSAVDEKAVTVVGRLADMAAGKTGTLPVKLAAGHYVLICNRPDHYKNGMYADFTVTP